MNLITIALEFEENKTRERENKTRENESACCEAKMLGGAKMLRGRLNVQGDNTFRGHDMLRGTLLSNNLYSFMSPLTVPFPLLRGI